MFVCLYVCILVRSVRVLCGPIIQQSTQSRQLFNMYLLFMYVYIYIYIYIYIYKFCNFDRGNKDKSTSWTVICKHRLRLRLRE